MVSTSEALWQRAEGGARRGGQIETLYRRVEITRIIDKIVRAMAEHRYPEKDVFAVRLAIEEALVNAIRHGNRDDLTKGVGVSFLVGPERVLIEVQDEGDGFKLKDVSDPLAEENLERPSGRGLHLMRTYMTWVRFNSRGNCVTLCKSRSAAK